MVGGFVPAARLAIDPTARQPFTSCSVGQNQVNAQSLVAPEAARAVIPPGKFIVGAVEITKTVLQANGVQLTEVPRAERHAAVAAASILARQEFLLGLAELSEECGITLHKGAGAPVDAVGARLVKAHGEGALHELAKLHFKNTSKIRARV